MKKKIIFKPILISIGLILIQSSIFFVTKLIQPTPHLIGNSIDEIIPFNIYFIIPYFIWYIMLFAVPYYLYIKDKNAFKKFVISYFFTTIISGIVFIIYPTTVIRPDVSVTGFFTLLAKIAFTIDTPAVNCLPSLHCAISMIFALCTFSSKKIKLPYKLIVTIISISIMISTLFVKQHVFIDLVTGDILAILVLLIFGYNKYLNKKIEELLKL